MKTSTIREIFTAIFDDLSVQDFLDNHPDYTERMIYEMRDDILTLLKEQSVKEGKSYTLYIDGASQPQKKKAGVGGVIFLDDSEIESFAEYIGEATNNEAEYTALIRGCNILEKYKPEKVYIFADSEFVVKQINGEYQVKNERMKKLYGKAMNALHQFPHWTFEHIPRERNKRADKLSKQALLQKESGEHS